MGLRQTRKQGTEQLIRRSALELAKHQPIEAIPVEAICQKAGISYRTFFNYFAYKEAAFLMPPPAFPTEAVDRFISGREPLIERAATLLAAQAEAAEDIEMIAVAHDIAAANPKVAALQSASFMEFERALAGLIARAGARPVPDLDDHVLASALLGALRVVLDNSDLTDRKALRSAIERHIGKLAIPSATRA